MFVVFLIPNPFFLGFLHLISCEKNEVNIISERNYNILWPFTFFPWLLSLAVYPIQYFNASLGLLYFSQNVSDSGVSIKINHFNVFVELLSHLLLRLMNCIYSLQCY